MIARVDLRLGRVWPSRLVLCAVCPMLVSPAAAQTSLQWPSERPPRPLQPREAQFPPYEIKTLPNGMQVIAVAHHEQPIISVRLLVKAGAANDPEGKSGVASLAASLRSSSLLAPSAPRTARRLTLGGRERSEGPPNG